MRHMADKKTGDLLQTPNAKRQAEFRSRQSEAGRKQYSFWLTENEVKAMKETLILLRGGENE